MIARPWFTVVGICKADIIPITTRLRAADPDDAIAMAQRFALSCDDFTLALVYAGRVHTLPTPEPLRGAPMT